jgi:hypothetical protein
MTTLKERLTQIVIPHSLKDNELNDIMYECEEILTFLAGIVFQYEALNKLSKKEYLILNNILHQIQSQIAQINHINNNSEAQIAMKVCKNILEIANLIYKQN